MKYVLTRGSLVSHLQTMRLISVWTSANTDCLADGGNAEDWSLLLYLYDEDDKTTREVYQ